MDRPAELTLSALLFLRYPFPSSLSSASRLCSATPNLSSFSQISSLAPIPVQSPSLAEVPEILCMHAPDSIFTERLTLLPASAASMRAEIESPIRLASFLNVVLPKAWPPPLNDADSQRWMLDYLTQHASSRWGMYYIVRTADAQLVGNCGFKGEPRNHAVELGYSIASEHQRNGYASEAVRGLVRFAFSDPVLHRVLAETLPELTPSIGVLRKCGFRQVRGASEPGAIRFSLPRGRFAEGRFLRMSS